MPISCFWKILITYSRFSRIYWTDRQDVLENDFSKNIKSEFQNAEISQNNMFEICRFFLELFGVSGVSKDKNDWFWESWSRPLGPTLMKMRGGGRVLM